MSAGVAAGHPATAEVGLRILAAGGSAADAAVAAMLACCVAESILTGIGGGGFATYYDAATGTVTCLDFFCSVPGLDDDVEGRPDGADRGVLRRRADDLLDRRRQRRRARRAGRLRRGAPPLGPAALGTRRRAGGHAGPRAASCCPRRRPARSSRSRPALMPGDGAAIYAPGGRLLQGGDLLHHPGLRPGAGRRWPSEGPASSTPGRSARAWSRRSATAGGALGPADLAAYRVLEVPVASARAGRAHRRRPHDLNGTIATIARPAARIADDAPRPTRAVALANALREQRTAAARRHHEHLGGRRGRATPA